MNPVSFFGGVSGEILYAVPYPAPSADLEGGIKTVGEFLRGGSSLRAGLGGAGPRVSATVFLSPGTRFHPVIPGVIADWEHLFNVGPFSLAGLPHQVDSYGGGLYWPLEDKAYISLLYLAVKDHERDYGQLILRVGWQLFPSAGEK